MGFKEVKKGSTHVGFVLSFVIFVTFLMFLYSIIIEPTRTSQDKEFLLEKISGNLIESVSLDLSSFAIITGDNLESCLRLNGLISDLGVNSHVIVKNKDDSVQTAYVLGNDLEIVRENFDETFFKIYYSEEFNTLGNNSIDPCGNQTYQKGLSKIERYIFEGNIINFIDMYENDYEGVKQILEVPKGSEFNFNFVYDNKTNIGPERDVLTNVYVEEFQVQYFNINGTILLGKFNIRLW